MDVLVDTNLIVSFFTNRNESQQETARELFARAARGEIRAWLPQFTIFEVAHVLRVAEGASAADTRLAIANTLSVSGIDVANELSWDRLLSLWPELIPDLTDAGLAAIAIDNGWHVATFDRKFARRLDRLGIETWRA